MSSEKVTNLEINKLIFQKLNSLAEYSEEEYHTFKKVVRIFWGCSALVLVIALFYYSTIYNFSAFEAFVGFLISLLLLVSFPLYSAFAYKTETLYALREWKNAKNFLLEHRDFFISQRTY